MKRGTRPLLGFILIVLALLGSSSLWLRAQQRQYKRNRQLIEALVKDDKNQALELVMSGADPNTRVNPPPAPSLKLLLQQCLHHQPLPDDDSPTAFLLACEDNYSRGKVDWGLDQHAEDTQLVLTMLAHGADINARSERGETALHIAGRLSLPHLFELLLEHGANVKVQNDDGDTPLREAVAHTWPTLVHLILTRGAPVDVQDPFGDTVLHTAAASPHAMIVDRPGHYVRDDEAQVSIVRQLLAHGADPNLPDRNGETPITLAQKCERPDIVALLRKGRK